MATGATVRARPAANNPRAAVRVTRAGTAPNQAQAATTGTSTSAFSRVRASPPRATPSPSHSRFAPGAPVARAAMAASIAATKNTSSPDFWISPSKKIAGA